MQRELKILLSTSGLSILAAGLFGPIYAVFVEQIGGDLLTAGTAYSAFAIAAGVLIFFISRWEDNVKHKEKLVVIAYFLACLGFVGYLLIKNPFDLFLVQIVFGVSTAIGAPAYDGLYSKHLDKGKFISQWGIWESMNYIVMGIAAAVGGFIANLYGFKVLFWAMLGLSLLALAVSLLLLVRKKRK
jgi:MFS family permease